METQRASQNRLPKTEAMENHATRVAGISFFDYFLSVVGGLIPMSTPLPLDLLQVYGVNYVKIK